MAATGKNRRLTGKQALFVKEYLVDMNATGAALRAGYSQKSCMVIGYQLLQIPLVQAAIEKANADRVNRVEISADYVLKSLYKVAERCLQEIPVTDKEGKPTGEWRFEPAGANKALELLGKNLKLFTDKMDLRTIKDIEDLTEEEQISLAKKLLEREGEGSR